MSESANSCWTCKYAAYRPYDDGHGSRYNPSLRRYCKKLKQFTYEDHCNLFELYHI